MYQVLEAWGKDAEHRSFHLGNTLGSLSPGTIQLVIRLGLALFLLGMLLASLFVSATPVLATADPDSVQFISVHANRHLYETGDYMLMIHYAINYGALPDDPVDETFIFRLMDTDGSTELGANIAYPFADDGYGQGIVTLYWPAAEAPAWDGLYIVRASGNPSAFANPPVYNYTMVPSDYCSETDQEGQQENMATWLLDVAMALEVAWDASLLDLTDTGVVLSTTGESYFRYAVPGLQVLAPELFYVQVSQPDWGEQSWGTNQSANYTSRYEGTWVGDAIDDAASLFSIEPVMISGTFILGACVAFIILSAKRFQTTLPGFIAGIALTTCGGLMGWISPAMLGVIGMMFALYIGYFLLFQRA